MFKLFLNRFAAIDSDRAVLITDEELTTWPQDDVAALMRFNLVKRATPANIVECPGCEEACLMPVNVYPAQDDRPARIFIACNNREDTGPIPIDPADLEQWQIDISRFASMLATSLGTDHTPDEIIPNQAFYLGALTINRKKRSAIFVGNKETLDSSLETGLFEQYPNPFFLVAAGMNGPQKKKQGQTIPLLWVLMPSEKGLSVDLVSLRGALSTKGAARLDVAPISVPPGTKWEQVFISFVNDQTVQIRVGGKTEHRSFDEMGFSDARKAEIQPSGLWGVFRQLAKLKGELTFQDSIKTFKDPQKIKKWVSQIRKKLQDVFPGIPGDPFLPYIQGKGYKTRFFLNNLPTST